MYVLANEILSDMCPAKCSKYFFIPQCLQFFDTLTTGKSKWCLICAICCFFRNVMVIEKKQFFTIYYSKLHQVLPHIFQRILQIVVMATFNISVHNLEALFEQKSHVKYQQHSLYHFYYMFILISVSTVISAVSASPVLSNVCHKLLKTTPAAIVECTIQKSNKK